MPPPRDRATPSMRWLQAVACVPLAACTLVLAPWDDLSDGAGACASCGSEQTCVDLLDDEKHCGACDHGCDPGRSCNDGRCEPVEILTALSQPGSVLVEGENLFVVEQVADAPARLFRVDRSLTNPRACLAAEGCTSDQNDCCNKHRYGEASGPDVAAAEISGLAYFAKEARIVWSERTGRVCNVHADAGNYDPCVRDDGATIEGIAIGGAAGEESVFWTNTATGTIARRPIFGDATSVFVSGSSPRWIATTAEGVYFTDGLDIRHASYAGGAAPDDVVRGAGNVEALAATPRHLYWASDKGVFRLSLESPVGATPEVLSTAPADAVAIYESLEGAVVFWTERGGGCPRQGELTAHDGQVVRWRESDGSTLSVAKDQACPTFVTVDDTHVYWTTSASPTRAETGSIWRLRR